MTTFNNGDRVKATNGTSTLIGEYRDTGGSEYFDIKFADAYEFAQIRGNLWTLEPYEPTVEETLNALPIGTRFKTEGQHEFIKVNADGYIETDEKMATQGAKYGSSVFLHAEDFSDPLQLQGVDYE